MRLDVWPSDVVAEYQRAGWWDEQTLSSLVSRHARERPDASAFYGDDGSAMTWRDYDEQAGQLAAALGALQLQRGDGVAVMLPDRPLIHSSYVGVERAGHVVVAIAHRAAYSDVREIIRRSDARALVALPDHGGQSTADHVKRLRDDTGWTGHYVELHPRDAGLEISVDGSAAEMEPPTPERALTADELFLVNFTSGTTGLPKLVMHTQNRWKYFHKKCWHFREEDVFLIGLPTTGGFGLWTAHFSPLLLGAPAVLMERFDPAEMLAAIERHHVTVLAVVPTQMNVLLECPTLETTDLSSLRIVESGGEHVPFQKAAEFEARTGAAVIQFYGSTEAGCVSGPTSALDTQERRLNTSGKPIEEMNVRLFDASGNDVTPMGRGQCGARGPALTPGYYGDPEATATLYRPDGWLLLGDIVEIDEQGYLHVIGRVSDFIIRGGLNISAYAVEDAVRHHPRVADTAAVAMPDQVMGERVCCYVTTNDGAPLELADLTRFLEEESVTKSLWPERLICLAELPTSAGGKIAKSELRRDIRERLESESRRTSA